MLHFFCTQEKLTCHLKPVLHLILHPLTWPFLNTHLLFLLAMESETLHRLNWDPHFQVKPSWLFCLTVSLQVITAHKLISKDFISTSRPQVVMATASLNYNGTTVMPISSQSTDCYPFFLFFSSRVGFFAPPFNTFFSFVFWPHLVRPWIIGVL